MPEFDPARNDEDFRVFAENVTRSFRERLSGLFGWADGDIRVRTRTAARRLPDGKREVAVFGEIDPVSAAMNSDLAFIGEQLAARRLFLNLIDFFPDVQFPVFEKCVKNRNMSYEEVWLDCLNHMTELGRGDEWRNALSRAAAPVPARYFLIFTASLDPALPDESRMSFSMRPAVDSPLLLPSESAEMLPFSAWLADFLKEGRSDDADASD